MREPDVPRVEVSAIGLEPRVMVRRRFPWAGRVDGDGGGKAPAAPAPIRGRELAAQAFVRFTAQAMRHGVTARAAVVNGQPGAIAYDPDGRIVSVLEIDVGDGVITAIHAVINPDKLGHLGPVGDLRELYRTGPGR
jgi:RNA polymerase sigma-70 factor (ECF subfamily)